MYRGFMKIKISKVNKDFFLEITFSEKIIGIQMPSCFEKLKKQAQENIVKSIIEEIFVIYHKDILDDLYLDAKKQLVKFINVFEEDTVKNMTDSVFSKMMGDIPEEFKEKEHFEEKFKQGSIVDGMPTIKHKESCTCPLCKEKK